MGTIGTIGTIGFDSIYDIDEKMLEIFDEEGQIDAEKIDQIEMDRRSKIESIALLVLHETSKAEDIKAYADDIKARAESHKKKAENAKAYLSLLCNGEKFESPKVKVSFRSSTSCEITDESLLPDEFWKVETVKKPMTAEAKKALVEGKVVPGAKLVTKTNAQVKQ